MKIRMMSTYDVAKNLLEIIKSAPVESSKGKFDVAKKIATTEIPMYQKAVKAVDTFVKQSEKDVK